MSIENTTTEKDYWTLRYQEQRTGWDIGYTSTPLQSYIDQLKNKELKILIPGAGNSYEAEYFFKKGLEQVYILDIAPESLVAFSERVPDFPKYQIIEENFFEHTGVYDLILEQTFFCSFPPTPENREHYAQKMHELLADNGKLVGLWFDFPLTGDLKKRPFGGTREEYLDYLSPLFEIQTFETCYNSIQPRANTELFGIFQKKQRKTD